MKKINRLVRLLLWIATYGITTLCVISIHGEETVRRGYEAIGGEFTLFLLPIMVYIAIDTAKKWFDRPTTPKNRK